MIRPALALCLVVLAACTTPRPVLRAGLLADIQYADKEDSGKRHYRGTLDAFERCVTDWEDEDFDFVCQLGDIIDDRDTLDQSREDLDRVLALFERLGDEELVHVLGNHCFSVPRPELMRKLEMELPYHSWSEAGWRFIVLDALQFSECGWPEGSAQREAGTAWLELHESDGEWARPWNGALGRRQRAWLRNELWRAERAREKAVIFCHLPTLEEAAEAVTILWDHPQVLEILDASPAAFAWFAGHHHAGGYAQRSGVHHVTIEGMLEAPLGGAAHAIAEFWSDRIELVGVGTVTSRTLR